jgi:hypothetical protein
MTSTRGQAPAATSGGIRARAAADGTPYRQALNEHAPARVRDAVENGTLVWSVPWRGPGRSYFQLFDTTAGPVLRTDILIGWSYAWGWPDTAAAVRHVSGYAAALDLAEDYGRLHAAVLLDGPWGTVICQGLGNIRAILHTEHGPQTRWYQTSEQALADAAAHVTNSHRWAHRLHGPDHLARAAELQRAAAAAAAALAALRGPAGTETPGPGSLLRTAILRGLTAPAAWIRAGGNGNSRRRATA